MANQLRFDNRVVVVTGAGAGLGKEYALLFAKRGAKVVVNDLGGNFHGEGKSNAADIVVKEITDAGGIAVADYNSVVEGQKIIETAIKSFGRLDVLVNNAGILRDRSLVKMTDDDWDKINDIHLKACFITTRAAWPIFRQQKFGRIIMTSSNSGIYGNFGQANYSAAKLGAIGLANSIAIEGGKYNIHCNTIVPTAASRMTKDILPEEFYNELKPVLIAPVVAYLCHENTIDNGSVIESACGWATKIHFVRGKGSLLRTAISDEVTLEFVRDKWNQITDMTDASHLESVAEASGSFMGILEELKSGLTPQSKFEDTFSYTSRDLILYSLGIGISTDDNNNLRYLYENNADFAAFPTFSILPGLILSMTSGLVSSAISNFDLSQVLHGEQYVELLQPLPTECKLITRAKVIDVLDKKSGAVVVSLAESFDPNGQLIIRNQSSTFIVGAGNFGGKSKPSDEVIPTISNPTRSPDFTTLCKTTVDQAALYRLSGDYNPMHIDPNFSKLGGFQKPILHGLATLAISVRAIIKQYANNDPALFKAVKVRFTKPVYPGNTLKVEMWQEQNRIHFKTSLADNSNAEVLSGAYVDLFNVVKATTAKETIVPEVSSSNMVSLQSDAVFQAIADRVKADPAKAKAVNAVFLYKITKDGKVVKDWTLDLKKGIVTEGTPTGKADTTLTVSDSDFVDIAMNKLNPQTAFMKGKLKIQGNIMLTQKLVPLLKTEAKL